VTNALSSPLSFGYTLPPGWLVISLDEAARQDAEAIINDLGAFAVQQIEDEALRIQTNEKVCSMLRVDADRARELGGQQMLLQIAGGFGTLQASSCIVAQKGTVLDPEELELSTLLSLAERDFAADGDEVSLALVQGSDGGVRIVALGDPTTPGPVDVQYFIPIPGTSELLSFTFEMRLGLLRHDALRLFDTIVDSLRFIATELEESRPESGNDG